MVRFNKRLLLGSGLGVLLITGIVFRHKIRNLIFRQKSVAGVVEQLRARRGHEFLQSYPDLASIREVFLVAVKNSRKLEVWTRNDKEEIFQHRKTYLFTGFSGGPGPKRQSGDRQIPEGVYEISGLNPNSRLHLSLKVGYPNATDQAFAKAEGRGELGGDIFIHGSNTSVGCIPIGNRNIEELFYLIAVAAPQKTTITIMPVDFRLQRHRAYKGKTKYEWEVYRLARKEIRLKMPPRDLGATFSGIVRKKA